MAPQDTEPKPLEACVPFEEWDFEALSPERGRSAEYNEHRLRARRKLAALAKVFVQRVKKDPGLLLESRTSIHNPHQFNGNRVHRLWAYVTRSKKEKTRLRRVLGADLAKDLNQAYKNAYLCIAIEHDALEVSFRIHPDGWYDGQNLIKRTAAEGVRSLLDVLNGLDGFHLRLHDWKGEWPCGAMEVERLEEFLRFYTPGEHRLVVERRWPAPPGAREPALGEDVHEHLVDELARLVPLYRWAAWSEESDHLFSR